MADREKLRYSDAELAEFKALIETKIAAAQREYDEIMDQIAGRSNNDIADASLHYNVLEEGSRVQSKEELTFMASRQQKFIQNLRAALTRIENKTYGICRITGKLIPKERLRAVPHATTSIEGKQMEKRRLG